MKKKYLSDILKCYTVTQLFGLRNFKSYTVTQLHNYIIHWLGKIIGKNICLIFWSVTQLHSKQCRINQMKWKKNCLIIWSVTQLHSNLVWYK